MGSVTLTLTLILALIPARTRTLTRTLTLTLTLTLTRFGPGGVTAAVPPRLPTPSPDLLKKHQVAHQEAIRQPDPLTPLCMDHRALKNTQDTTTGTGMALPGKYFLKGGMAADNPGLV